MRDLAGVEVLVLLERVEGLWEVVVWGTVSLVERAVLHTSTGLSIEQATVVEVGEHAVVGNHMVERCWLVIVQVSEFSGTAGAEEEWQLGVAVVDAVNFLSVQELEQVVLNNWVLTHGTDLGSRGLSSNAVTEGEDVLEARVLEGVLVDVNHALSVSETGVSEPLEWLTGWVDAGTEEWLLDGLASLDVAEGGNLLLVLVKVHLDHFPAEVHVDVSLGALVEGDFVGVWETVDLFVWSEVLDSGRLVSGLLDRVESVDALVVWGIEVASFSLVWELWGVGDEITGLLSVSVPEVAGDAFLAVEEVHEDVVNFRGGFHLWKSLDEIGLVLETWGEDEGLVVEDLSVAERDGVGMGINLFNSLATLNSGPTVNHTGETGTLDLLSVDLLMANTEVRSGQDVLLLVGNDAHFQILSIIMLLQELCQSGDVQSTFKRKQIR